MISIFRTLYISDRFFVVLGFIIVLAAAGFFIPWMYGLSVYLLFIFCAILLIEAALLYLPSRTTDAHRILPEKMSNGDDNEITIHIRNHYHFLIDVQVIDELPYQLQERNFNIRRQITKVGNTNIRYLVKPFERGEYEFGKLLLYVTTRIGLVRRRFSFDHHATCAVYPSFIRLRKFDLMAISDRLVMYGVKKVRRLGHTMEFEKINEYVTGDDIRTINWKATAKTGRLMVNQYQDEKSQSVYCIIDTGRVMKMPFDGLTLLDHAINSCLVVSNVIIRKNDKAGLLTFSKKTGQSLPASSQAGQMQKIVESLYAVRTDFQESDFSRLYGYIRSHIAQRSLILLFTNFETMDGLNRQLRYIKAIASYHLVVVIFFENTSLNELSAQKADTKEAMYDKVIAEKFSYEKKLIVKALSSYGISSVLTTPDKLTIDTINQYILLKSKGRI